MVQRIKLGIVALLFGIAAASCIAADAGLRFENQSATGANFLVIQGVASSDLDVSFSHSEVSPACSFELKFKAAQKPATGDPDDYNEAMPDGTYVQVFNYSSDNKNILALSVDRKTSKARFASINISLPPSYDVKKCKLKKNTLEVLFFRK